MAFILPAARPRYGSTTPVWPARADAALASLQAIMARLTGPSRGGSAARLRRRSAPLTDAERRAYAGRKYIVPLIEATHRRLSPSRSILARACPRRTWTGPSRGNTPGIRSISCRALALAEGHLSWHRFSPFRAHHQQAPLTAFSCCTDDRHHVEVVRLSQRLHKGPVHLRQRRHHRLPELLGAYRTRAPHWQRAGVVHLLEPPQHLANRPLHQVVQSA